eukprot:m.53993 g.53993  ORF g.53993 m.53993 type:complete len:251 (-) comp6813_c0_seq2:100-852(-)
MPPLRETRFSITAVKTDKKGRKIAFGTNGRDKIFVPQWLYSRLEGPPQVGEELVLLCGRSPHGPGLQASDQVRESVEPWEDWQHGGDAIPLPDTLIEEDISDSLRFLCWGCGATIVSGADIARIKGASIWTNNADMESLEAYNPPAYNEHKNCRFQTARCTACKMMIGAYYGSRYADAPPEQSFPTYKLTYTYERHADKSIQSSLVIDADTMEEAEDLIDQLPKKGTHAFRSRTNAATHDLVYGLQNLAI